MLLIMGVDNDDPRDKHLFPELAMTIHVQKVVDTLKTDLGDMLPTGPDIALFASDAPESPLPMTMDMQEVATTYHSLPGVLHLHYKIICTGDPAHLPIADQRLDVEQPETTTCTVASHWWVYAGVRVEVLQTLEGFAGSHYAAHVTDAPHNGKASVEYEEFASATNPDEHLREWVPVTDLRPVPPSTPSTPTAWIWSTEVDARLHSGWWPATVKRAGVCDDAEHVEVCALDTTQTLPVADLRPRWTLNTHSFQWEHASDGVRVQTPMEERVRIKVLPLHSSGAHATALVARGANPKLILLGGRPWVTLGKIFRACQRRWRCTETPAIRFSTSKQPLDDLDVTVGELLAMTPARTSSRADIVLVYTDVEDMDMDMDVEMVAEPETALTLVHASHDESEGHMVETEADGAADGAETALALVQESRDARSLALDAHIQKLETGGTVLPGFLIDMYDDPRGIKTIELIDIHKFECKVCPTKAPRVCNSTRDLLQHLSSRKHWKAIQKIRKEPRDRATWELFVIGNPFARETRKPKPLQLK